MFLNAIKQALAYVVWGVLNVLTGIALLPLLFLIGLETIVAWSLNRVEGRTVIQQEPCAQKER